MKLLVDANLSPVVVAALKCAGRTAVHVADIGLLTASDDAIVDRAAADGYVVNELPPEAQGALLVANLPTVAEDLGRGAIVSLSPTRMAVRRLPVT